MLGFCWEPSSEFPRIAERTQALSYPVAAYKDINLIVRAPPSRPNYLPRDPSPTAITLEFRVSTHEFAGDINVLSIAHRKWHYCTYIMKRSIYCRGSALRVRWVCGRSYLRQAFSVLCPDPLYWASIPIAQPPTPFPKTAVMDRCCFSLSQSHERTNAFPSRVDNSAMSCVLESPPM